MEILLKQDPIKTYISYLEYQFDNNMSWDNYGKYWQIDHVNPICNFNLEDNIEQKQAFNWKNTRPLKTYDNLSRSNKSDFIEISKHNMIVENFLQCDTFKLLETPAHLREAVLNDKSFSAVELNILK